MITEVAICRVNMHTGKPREPCKKNGRRTYGILAPLSAVMEVPLLLKTDDGLQRTPNRGICWFVLYVFLPTKAVTEGKINVAYMQVTMSQLTERSTAGQLVAKLTELTLD